jgi:DNA/RNA-binding domain of Phe-tRNA-synthetase-like protein
MKFKIDPQIFARFPGIRIGVLILQGIDNGKGQQGALKILREEEKKQNSLLQGVDFGTLPETAGWRPIYEAFGSKPRDYRSSVEALLRRVRAGSGSLPSINPLVDLYNYISIHYYLPVGAEDLGKVVGDIKLTYAKGNESGKYIGGVEEETCYSGEVIYRDQEGFICRRWNWREADRTKIDENTKNAVLVIEALPVVSDEKLMSVLGEAKRLIEEQLGGRAMQKVLSVNDPEIEV